MNITALTGLGQEVSTVRAKQTSGGRAKSVEVAGNAPAPKQDAPPISREQAQQVAKQLNVDFDKTSLRFSVIDPRKSGPHNIVIEVLDKNDKVVAEIPAKAVRELAKNMATGVPGLSAKNLLVNTNV